MMKDPQPGTIEIRPLTLADEPFLWEMLYHALYVPEGYPPFPRGIVLKPEISRYLDGWGKPDDSGYLVLDSGKPVGAVWLRLLTGDQPGFGYNDETTPELSIAILPEYRGRGIGSQLITRLIELAQSQYPAICLSVSPDNPAKALYLRMGFKVVEENESSSRMIKRFRK